MFWKLFNDYIKPNFVILFFALICTAIASVGTVAVVKLVKPIIDDVFVQKNEYMLRIAAIYFLIASFMRGVGDYGESILLTKVGQSMIKDLQVRTFNHLMSCDLNFFHKKSSGELISRLTNDINEIKQIITIVIANFSKDCFTAIGILIYMVLEDPIFTFIATIGFSVTVLPTLKIGKKVKKIAYTTQETMSVWVGFLGQIFQGMRLVKAYAMEKYLMQKALCISTDIYKLCMKSTIIRSAIHPIIEFLTGIAVSGIIVMGGWLVISGERTAGTFLSFITALIFIYQPIKRLTNAHSLIQEALASASRLYAILEVKPEIVNSLDAKNLKITDCKIEFHNVNFVYPSGFKAVNDVNFSVKHGEKIAFVGPSGAGKSTLVNLIARFYDTSSGEIFIDGQNIKNVTIESLRSAISVVSQEITLFDDTIFSNILYGNLEANVDQVVKAAQCAACDFIDDLPKGFETIVGENGVLLSGGQRQRIAIARAILKNAPILLFDEATSSLDAQSEHKIQEVLNLFVKGRTTFTIAHRLSTVLNSDRIIVMSGGKIVESGIHEDLIAKNGMYCQLYKTQFGAVVQ